MKVLKIIYVKDGGSLYVNCNDGNEYFIDRAIGSKNKNAVYICTWPEQNEVRVQIHDSVAEVIRACVDEYLKPSVTKKE